MENEQNKPLFDLQIDASGKAHLSEAATWARFLAIIGFIFLVLMVFYGFWMVTMMDSVMGELGGGIYGNDMLSGAGTMIAVLYLVIAIIYFFPLMFTLRFANKMKQALATNDQVVLNDSLKNLKITLRYLGILTIIALVFVIIAVLGGVMALSGM